LRLHDLYCSGMKKLLVGPRQGQLTCIIKVVNKTEITISHNP
jgi:hypothetical protein